MITVIKIAEKLEELDWIEIGDTIYQVEKTPETNDFGDKVVHLRPSPELASSMMLIVKPNIVMKTYFMQ